MIQLHSDCLVFKTSNGQTIPCSAEMVAVELMGDSAKLVDPELIHNASNAVLHYFKEEHRQTVVSVDEFTEALAKVLRGFGLKVTIPLEEGKPPTRITEADLSELVEGPETLMELTFFPRLREAVQAGLDDRPDILRFIQLKGCVKQLVGAKRWCPRCERMRDRVLGYLNRCWLDNERSAQTALLVN